MKTAPLQLLSKDKLNALHQATLQVLEKTGVRFESERALALLADHGCAIDRATMRAKIPGELVQKCLAGCPPRFGVSARRPRHDLTLGGDELYFYNSMGNQTVDPQTWEPRVPTLVEQHDAIRVLDALDDLHIVGSYSPYMEIEGVPPDMVLPESFASRIRNSTKVTIAGYSQNSEVFAIKMAQAVDLEVPGWVMAAPPLTYYQDACEAAFRFTAAGFPIFLVSGVGYGTTGPATIAGSTVTNNAELLAGLVLIQVIQPGARVLVSDFSFPTNMRTGTPSFGNVAAALHGTLFAQIWRNYRIPVGISFSGYSNAKTVDYQSGYEKTFAGLTAALAGADIVSLHGGVFAELSYHPVQSVLDDDIAGMIRHFLQGVEFSEETLALELIDTVCRGKGHFLDSEHTFKWWQKEQFLPRSADNLTYPTWQDRGKPTALENARERMEQILATHHPAPLSDAQNLAIDAILKEARIHYGCWP